MRALFGRDQEAVGDDVVAPRRAERARIGQPVHLHPRRAQGEQFGPRAFAETIEIDQDVGLVFAQFQQHAIERARRNIAEFSERGRDPVAQHAAVVGRGRVAGRLQCLPAQAFDQFDHQQRGRMLAETGRNESHPQRAFAATVRARPEALLQRFDFQFASRGKRACAGQLLGGRGVFHQHRKRRDSRSAGFDAGNQAPRQRRQRAPVAQPPVHEGELRQRRPIVGDQRQACLERAHRRGETAFAFKADRVLAVRFEFRNGPEGFNVYREFCALGQVSP